MNSRLAPVLLVIAAIALFFFYVEPEYRDVQEMLTEKEAFDLSRAQADDLANIRDGLEAQYQAFSDREREEVNTFITPQPDQPRLFATLDEIASQNAVLLTDVSLVTGSQSRSRARAQDERAGGIQTVPVSFGADGRYGNFLSFIEGVENSLQLMDITRIAITPSSDEGFVYSYEVDVQAYSM